MTEQELKAEFKAFAESKENFDLFVYADEIADYWLSKRQAELSSLRGEIEGEKKHPSDFSIPEHTLNTSYSYQAGYNRGSRDSTDKSLEHLDKLIGTK